MMAPVAPRNMHLPSPTPPMRDEKGGFLLFFADAGHLSQIRLPLRDSLRMLDFILVSSLYVAVPCTVATLLSKRRIPPLPPRV